jgi:hypothetical protein
MSLFSALSVGGYGSFEFGGRVYGAIAAPAMSAGNRAAVDTWLGAKAGLVL